MNKVCYGLSDQTFMMMNLYGHGGTAVNFVIMDGLAKDCSFVSSWCFSIWPHMVIQKEL